MIKRTLPALLLLVAIVAYAKKPPAKPRPPPPPVADVVDEEHALPLEDERPDEATAPLDDKLEGDENPAGEDAPPPDNRRIKAGTPADEEILDAQVQAIALGSMCCCLLFVLGLVVLIVWLVKRRGGTLNPVQSNFPPPQGFAPAPGQAGGMQLSILALALEPGAREVVEQELSQLGISPVPTAPETRARLVREAARALLTVQSSWRQFGYGEKPGIADLASAESSYRSASEDFRARALAAGSTASPGSGLVVVTLLICSRRTLRGVPRLDDPQQVKSLLEDRLRVSDDELLGTELLWAPVAPGGRITEAEIALRFPEMLPLTRPAI